MNDIKKLMLSLVKHDHKLMNLWSELVDMDEIPDFADKIPNLIEEITEFLNKDSEFVIDTIDNHREGKITDEELLSLFFDK
ncbi:hypothetical protein [Peribacillus butanolivorans]|uniref:hypothetical protein n=1 Tax=Peribacillus butanolivorans TaxID=421767 RepID=UPI0006AC22AE|nr:hypothetical protein AM232_07720 [Bacillus sp. FJAT-21352]